MFVMLSIFWGNVLGNLEGYVVPGHVGDGAWMAWENYFVVAAVVIAVDGPLWGDMLNKNTTSGECFEMDLATQPRICQTNNIL